MKNSSGKYGFRHLKDCPACKYGTLDMVRNEDRSSTEEYVYVCADCGKRFKVEEKKP